MRKFNQNCEKPTPVNHRLPVYYPHTTHWRSYQVYAQRQILAISFQVYIIFCPLHFILRFHWTLLNCLGYEQPWIINTNLLHAVWRQFLTIQEIFFFKQKQTSSCKSWTYLNRPWGPTYLKTLWIPRESHWHYTPTSPPDLSQNAQTWPFRWASGGVQGSVPSIWQGWRWHNYYKG